MCNQILGLWQSDPDDIGVQQLFGDVSMEFKENGDLIYTIHEDGKDQMMFMTYEVKGNLLITDQPSNPRKEETAFSILPDGKLALYFGGVRSQYCRAR